jgi:glycosyltransferase involved in cell wall biosynthesis
METITDTRALTFSVVIEWENALLSELGRTREMLKQLHEQLTEAVEARYPNPEIIILYDKEAVDQQLIEEVVEEAAELEAWPADMRIIPTRGLEYYEQKNFGAQQSDSELIVFLDSDVIPEPGWLAALLETFQDPQMQVVGGNTYVAPEGLYGKSFGLFWFFERRAAGDGLRRTNQLWANNVAFRRQTFEAFPFRRENEAFRSQCTALWRTLQEHDIDIFIRERSKVSHPPPNGCRHFVSYALCQGHDIVLNRPSSVGRAASIADDLKRYVRTVGGMLKRIVRHHRDVQLGPAGIVGAIGIGFCYHTLTFAGALLTYIWPEIIQRYFAI